MANEGADNEDNVTVALNDGAGAKVQPNGASVIEPVYHDPAEKTITQAWPGVWLAACGSFAIYLDTKEQAEAWVAAKAEAHWLDLPIVNGIMSPPQLRAVRLADAFQATLPENHSGELTLNGEGSS